MATLSVMSTRRRRPAPATSKAPTSQAPVPVARLTTPAELVASLPWSVGFVPTESLVVLCCHEPRGRTGLCLRFDLPCPADTAALVQEVEQRVRAEKATRVVLAVYTEQHCGEQRGQGGRPRQELVTLLSQALDDLVLTEAVLVQRGRFWSYLCERSSCCPPEGTPVDAGRSSTAVRLLEAESVLDGQVVLPDRAAVAATIAAPPFLLAEVARQRCEGCEDLLMDSLRLLGPVPTRELSVAAWREAIVRFRTEPARLGEVEAAALAVSLTDVLTRDAVAAAWPDDEDAVTSLLVELCRRTPAPYDAPVCALLAWVTYAGGGGALVGIALERALATDPTYSLALLVAEALHRQVPPQLLRDVMTTVGPPRVVGL